MYLQNVKTLLGFPRKQNLKVAGRRLGNAAQITTTVRANWSLCVYKVTVGIKHTSKRRWTQKLKVKWGKQNV